MQSYQNVLHSIPIILISALTMVMTTLMFLSFFLSGIPRAM